MDPEQLHRTYIDLTTPHVADACMRVGVPVRCAPDGIRPLWAGTHTVGRVIPARHYGSVDVFLEAIERSEPGDARMHLGTTFRSQARRTATSPRGILTKPSHSGSTGL